LTENIFDFAVRLDYLNYEEEPDVFPNLNTYVDLSVSQNNFFWVEDDSGFPNLIQE
jgi:hypothetical protein